VNLLKRLLREPLVHFLAVGALLFVIYAGVSGPAPEPVNAIVVNPGQVERLAAGFQRVWRRPPTDDELRALVDDFVREEVYYREALALGLDRDDAVIRRRLRQKMEFLTDSGADLIEARPDALEAYLAAHEEDYRVPPRLALEQIYLGEAPPKERVESVLQALQTEREEDPWKIGERTLLPARMPLSAPDTIDGVFGKGFFERLQRLPVGQWAGPVESGYGVHVVRITESVPARRPALEDVHDAVLRDWKSAKARELREQLYARLRERYDVTLPGALAPDTESR